MTEEKINNKLKLLPLILGILGIIIGVIEGLNCPLLFGWESILTEMIIVVVGGLIALYLYQKTDETLITAVQFMLTGILMYALLRNMATYGAIIFIVSGILVLFISNNDFNIRNKKLISLPVLTVVLFVAILLVIGVSGEMFESNLENEVSLNNMAVATDEDFGFYDVNISGDLQLNTSIDYIEADVVYYDDESRILYTDTSFVENNPKTGEIYKIKSSYFDTYKPSRAEITLKNDPTDNNTFYSQNLTLTF